MRLTVDGTTQTIEDWAADYGIPCELIRSRLNRGWSEERAVTEPMLVQEGEKLTQDAAADSGSSSEPAVSQTPLKASSRKRPDRKTTAASEQRTERTPSKSRRTYTYKGVSRTVSEWADYLGITRQAMYLRIKTKGDDAFIRFLPR